MKNKKDTTNLTEYTLIGLKYELDNVELKIRSLCSTTPNIRNHVEEIKIQIEKISFLEKEIIKLDPTYNKPEVPF